MRSKKQSRTALSTMEAKFVAYTSVVQEAVWLNRLLNSLAVTSNRIDKVLINSDSQAAMVYTNDPKFHNKTKHIDIKYNYVKDMVARNEVNIQYISTHDIIADPMTK